MSMPVPATPSKTVDELGFRPYGNAGPGGSYANSNAIVDGIIAAGYCTPAPAPYDGAGAVQHGSQDQLLAAFEWFIGKTRADGVI